MSMKITGEFTTKSLIAAEKELNTSKSVVIEGFANKSVVDRGNDLIPPEAWKTAEFEKNPIMFFNHDRNIPIGKAVEVKVTSEGLKIKAHISKSKASPMPFIRDMIREKILRTFSVGFDPMGSEEKRDDGVNVIKQANLLEVSVVSIPMNQESDFNLSKSIPSWKTKSYEEAVSDVLKERGNRMLAKIHKIMNMTAKNVDGFDKKQVIKQIAEKSGLTADEVADILAGVKEPCDAFLKAFSQTLMIPSIVLKEQEDDGDKEMEDEDEKTSEEEDDKEMEEEEDEKTEEEEDKEEGEEDEESAEDKEDEEVSEDAEEEKSGDPVSTEMQMLLDEGLEQYKADSILEYLAGFETDTNEKLYAAILLNTAIKQGLDSEACVEIVDAKLAKQVERHIIEHLLTLLNAEKKDEKQAVAEKDETEFGNPHLTIAKSHLALSGAMLEQLKSIDANMREMKQIWLDMVQSKAEAPMPADESEAEEQAEDVADELSEDESEDLKQAKRIDLKKKKIENFIKRLDALSQ